MRPDGLQTGVKAAWQAFDFGNSLLWERFRIICPSSTDLLKLQTMTSEVPAWQAS